MIYYAALLVSSAFLLFILFRVKIWWALAQAVVPAAAIYFLLGSLEGMVFWLLCAVLAVLIPLIAIPFAKPAQRKQLPLVAALVFFAALTAAKEYEISTRKLLDDPGYRAMIQSDPALKARYEASPRLSRWLAESEKYRSPRRKVVTAATAKAETQPGKTGPRISLKGESDIAVWKRAMTGLPMQEGTIKLANGASLELPGKFRFIDREALEPALELVKEPIESDVLGWVVHQDAPLTERLNAWWVEVRTLGGGHVAIGDAATASLEDLKDRAFEETSQRGRQTGQLLSFLGFPIAPWASETEAAAAWVGAYGAGGQQVSLCRSMTLGRNDQVVFAMRTRFDPEWQELCFLSVKTLARHTTFESGKTYADYSRFSDSSRGEVVDFISGARIIGKGL